MSNVEPSDEAQLKAEHLRKSIEKIKKQRLRYSRERRKRAKELEMKIMELDNNELLELQQIQFLTKKQNKAYIVPEPEPPFFFDRAVHLNNHKNALRVIESIHKTGFSEVVIVRHKQTAKIYAMKKILKKNIVNKYNVWHQIHKNIRTLMAAPDDIWLIKLEYYFQCALYMNVLMEYCGGGDLMGLLIRKQRLSESDALFFISQLSAAINYIHEKGFFYRDLTPNDILIANDGNIKLSHLHINTSTIWRSSNDIQLQNWQQYVATLDHTKLINEPEEEIYPFNRRQRVVLVDGYIRRIEGFLNENEIKYLFPKSLNEICFKYYYIHKTVSPNYIAMEVLYEKGYDKSVDWWSVGVILFECLMGYAPFNGYDPLSICRKIIQHQRYIKILNDRKLSQEVIDLIKQFICPPQRRIRWNQIKKHPWFKNIDWDNLKS